jgi:hypothetical protein
MRTKAVLASAAFTFVALVGCGGSNTEPRAEPSNPATADVEAVPTPTTEPEPTPTETPLGETSQRGNLIKEIGETAFMYHPGGDPSDRWFEFQITDATLGGECTGEFVEPSENGKFLILDITASTATNWPADMQGMTVDFTATDFAIIGPDGITESNVDTYAGTSCLPEGDLLPMAIGPGENVVGKVVLDTAAPSGVVVYKPWYGGGVTGWEWPF